MSEVSHSHDVCCVCLQKPGRQQTKQHREGCLLSPLWEVPQTPTRPLQTKYDLSYVLSLEICMNKLCLLWGVKFMSLYICSNNACPFMLCKLDYEVLMPDFLIALRITLDWVLYISFVQTLEFFYISFAQTLSSFIFHLFRLWVLYISVFQHRLKHLHKRYTSTDSDYKIKNCFQFHDFDTDSVGLFYIMITFMKYQHPRHILL